MRTIKKAGVVIKPHAPRVEEALAALGAYFADRGIGLLLEEAAAAKLSRPGGVPRDRIPEAADLIVVLGGDGTLLSIAHIAARLGVPVMGVNMGSLGFLTEVPLGEMTLTLDALLAGGGANLINPRMLIETSFNGREPGLSLNDVVINKGALARMIQMKIWIDDREIATIKADGLIVGTPTGSTAYSLSAGGPILQPEIPAMIMTPICPHTLTFRPIVVSSESTVRIQLVTAGEEVYLTLDGQRGGSMATNDVIEIRRAKYELSLVSSPKRNYFGLLREKLGWAE
jgi:NAD+ kinase